MARSYLGTIEPSTTGRGIPYLHFGGAITMTHQRRLRPAVYEPWRGRRLFPRVLLTTA